jgi:hypothetical protein
MTEVEVVEHVLQNSFKSHPRKTIREIRNLDGWMLS